MRRSFTPIIFAVSALALPQAESPIPGLTTCAYTAAAPAVLAAGCTADDKKCLCLNANFLDNARIAIAAACPSDVDAAGAVFSAYCADYAAPTATPISGTVDDPSMVTPTGDAGNQTVTDVPTHTTWSNGTICTKAPHCHDSNDTAPPMPSPTQPEEHCNGKCPTGGPAPTNSGTTGPKYTGAAAKVVTGSAIFGVAAVAAIFAL